jgi:hypothetical protein
VLITVVGGRGSKHVGSKHVGRGSKHVHFFYKMLHWINWIVLLSLEPLAGELKYASVCTEVAVFSSGLSASSFIMLSQLQELAARFKESSTRMH